MKTSGFEQDRAARQNRLSRGRRLLLAGYTCLLTVWLAGAAAAQPIDDATRIAARELAYRAADAYERADYTTAQDLFHRAYALVPAPTLSLREARALEKLGRLVEAAEAYVKTTRMTLDASSPEAFQQAVRQAAEELPKLRPRIPRLNIVVQGNSNGDAISVMMNGKPVSAALIGVDMPVDPGTHRITASTASGAGAAQSVVLKESESQKVSLELRPGAAARTVAFSGTPSAPGSASTGDRQPERTNSQRTWAFVSLGVGGAALGVGAITGVLAVNRHNDAEDGCPDGQCVEGSSGAKDVEAFHTLRTISTVGYIVGAVGVGTGAVLLLTVPKSKEKATSYVTPYLGFGQLGARGRF